MSLESSLLRWVGILEHEYGVNAQPNPATPANIAEFEEIADCELPPQIRALYEYSNGGLFGNASAHFLPRSILFLPLDKIARQPRPTWLDEDAWGIGYSATGPATSEQLVYLHPGTFELGFVCDGPATGAIFSVDGGAPAFEWSARSLSDLFDNCCDFYEDGYFDFTANLGWAHGFGSANPAQPEHSKLERGWSVLPFEADYSGDEWIGAWRWKS